MKKLFFLLSIIILFSSCKKEELTEKNICNTQMEKIDSLKIRVSILQIQGLNSGWITNNNCHLSDTINGNYDSHNSWELDLMNTLGRLADTYYEAEEIGCIESVPFEFTQSQIYNYCTL